MISPALATLLLVFSIAALAAAQLLAKYCLTVLGLAERSDGVLGLITLALSSPLMWCVALLIVGGAAMWYLAMTQLPVSVMLPMAGAVSPIVVLGAYLFLGESLDLAKIAAIALITVGVAWLAFQTA